MIEADEVWGTLRPTGFLHALREAHEIATKIVFGRLSRSAGFKERSFGYTSFDVLESQLDRVFRLGAFAPPSEGEGDPPVLDASGTRLLDGEDQLVGKVVRANLNGSPGWRYGRYRILLKRHPFGGVRTIRWAEDSPTKQAIAKQEYPDNPQLTLDLDLARENARPGALGEEDGLGHDHLVTLVMAHSATDAPFEMELFLGRPRFNPNGEDPWWWLRPLTDETLGEDPRHVPAPRPLPLWTDTEADAPVRLRPAREANQPQDISRNER